MKKKKGQSDDSGSAAGFRSMNVALSAILLAFFIVLNSLGAVDEKAMLTALGSLTGSFGILPGGLSTSQEGEVRVISGDHVPIDARDRICGDQQFGRIRARCSGHSENPLR